MNLYSFFGWLLSEAGAGWIFGILVLLISIFARKKIQRVVCKEIGVTSVVRIKEILQEKITIHFNDKPVENLAQIENEIYNEGTKVIKDVVLTFKYPQGTKILDVLPEKIEREPIEDRQVRVRIPYLNPRRHKHKVRATMIVDGTAENIQVTGGGEGWSIRSITLPTTTQLKSRLIIYSVLMLAVGISFLPYIHIIVRPIFGIYPSKISARAFLVILPWLLPFFGLYFWTIRTMILLRQRRKH